MTQRIASAFVYNLVCNTPAACIDSPVVPRNCSRPTCSGAGVHLRSGESIAADLVVDASGGNSRVSKWLEDIGHPAPPPFVVDAGLQYTCRMYERNRDAERDADMVMVMDSPRYNVMGVRLPIEHDKWQVITC